MIRSQSLIPLTAGAYKGRNAIADYEVSENVFMEVNPQETGSPTPTTHYCREGLRPLGTPPVAAVGRGLFVLSNGKLIAVVGGAVYAIGIGWTFSLLGTIASQTTPVSIADNGTTAVLVDGTSAGYQFLISTLSDWQAISDSTGTFVGSNQVVFSDTYLAFSVPGSNGWYVTDPDQVAFDALQQAAKDSKPDPIVAIGVNIRQFWLLGTQSTEVWFLAGTTPFPYQEWPSVFIPYGCAAAYSLVQADVNLYWISRNEQGQALAVKTNGNAVEAISTRALEYEWSTYATVSDVIGGTFQIAGHTYVVFHFPTADKSWAYDLSTKQWHRRSYTDTNGVSHREKVSFYASVGPDGGYPKTIVGQDWQTGQLYAVDPQYYTDNGQPIVCRRSFPHQIMDMKELTVAGFVADFAAGGATGTTETVNPRSFSQDFNSDFNITIGGASIPALALCLRYSRDGGKTWSNYRSKALISSGNYRSMMRYRGLGMGRDWVFELLWTYPGPTALQGAYIDAVAHSS